MATYPDGHTQGADCSGQTVLLDAMASGLPVLANRKAYLSDYVAENKEIIISDSTSPKELKEKIETLLSDAGLRKRLAEAARQKVENNFTSRLMARRLAEYFKQIK